MRNSILLLSIVGFLISCSEDKVSNNLPPVARFTAEDALDKIRLDAHLSTDPNNDPLSFNWSATPGTISIKANDDPSSAHFKIPADTKEDTVVITLQVTDRKQTNTTTLSIPVPPLTQVRSFGLGRSLAKEVSNNKPVEWYYDQGVTGPYSDVNCGPTSATMAIKWADASFQHTPEEARNTYRSSGGWWYTNDIINYLNQYNVNNTTIPLDMPGLKTQIDNGNIAILCLDMYYVSAAIHEADSEYRKGKFYATNFTGWGHFIVIKGYKEVDGITYFESYDPYSFSSKYSDQTPVGKDRYYASDNLDQATQIWWDYAIIVSKNKLASGRTLTGSEEIPNMPGR